jgi:uncharacterized protein YqgC (DUF456 family)
LSPLETAGLTVFILVLFAGVFVTVLGLPGTVIILADAFLYALITGFEPIGFRVILILTVIAVIAEAADFGLGMIGAARYGASRKGIWAALIGSVAGGVVATPFFMGVGTLLGIFLGGFAGVFLVESMEQRRMKPAFRASCGAVLGKVGGIMIKGLLSVLMVMITLYYIYS